MLVYQLEISIALAIVAGGSFALLAKHHHQPQGKIHLPVHSELHSHHDRDPFDVTEPEDLVDGYPIEGSKFWTRMKYRKIFLCALLAALLAVQAIGYIWFLVHDELFDLKSPVFEVCYSLYLLCLGLFCVRQVERHSEFIWHLTTLTTLPAALVTFVTIIPGREPSANDSSTSLWFWRVVLSFYIVLAFTTMNTPLGPPLYYPPSAIYSHETARSITKTEMENVTGVVGSSPWSTLCFTYVGKVVMLGNILKSLEIGDLPLMPTQLRATVNYDALKKAVRERRLSFWKPRPGSGAALAYQVFHANFSGLAAEATLTVLAALLFYLPPVCLSKLISYLEGDPNREDAAWGWFWVVALFTTNAVSSLVRGQLWSFCTTSVKLQMRIQLNALLFAKTLVRKDVASFAPSSSSTPSNEQKEEATEKQDFSSKAQIMTLMMTDVSRVGDSTFYVFDVIDAPIEIAIGAYFLYRLLGASSLIGLAVTCLFSPFNHFATKVVFGAQENLLKARDERMGLMNEVLGGIRMIKFMAWERNFEARVMRLRDKELKYQKLTYTINVLWSAIWNGSPMIVTLVSFWHFAVVRQQILTPSIAFTSVILFNEMKFALSALPNAVIKILQVVLSLRRIEEYLNLSEVKPVPPLERQSQAINFQSCTVTWPRDASSSTPTSTPHKFILVDLTLDFPLGELSLICGKIGSGKSLLLLALLGEADVVAGQMTCPRSPPDSLAFFANANISREDWLLEGMCAYVPQVSWLRNASIKENILFHLPYDQERYEKTLEACALVSDLEILEDGDDSEIGELGVTLSGGQKARVSLARAVYSRASIILLDDVLSAVDAHTAHHLYHVCLRGELMKGRTVILVSHHVQLCASAASYIVALDNGRVQFRGTREQFHDSDAVKTLVQSMTSEAVDKEEAAIESIPIDRIEPTVPGTSSDTVPGPPKIKDKNIPRKLVEQEARAVGRVAREVWETYIRACGDSWYWALFLAVFVIAAIFAVVENGWLSYWSGGNGPQDPTYYIMVYTTLTSIGLILTTTRWLVLYSGSIHASTVLYKRLLEAILFADIRFHDTSSRGRLLNRFGKDFEGIDSVLAENIGYCTVYVMATITSIITMSFVGGIPFAIVAFVIGIIIYNATSIFVQTTRDVQRLESVTQSPLYSTYSENIAGVAVLRAFGASSKVLRDMLRSIDTNSTAFYWVWGLNRWLSIRFDFLAGAVMCTIAGVAILDRNISASMAGLALAFSSTVTSNVLYLVRRWAQLEQSVVALERVNEYCEVEQEPPEFIEPRPPASWPSEGAIRCQNLVIRYAPELPAVLHNLTFNINPGEKVGILGRTGSGKSTLALSFLRFVAPSEGQIIIDGLDISEVGLADLRSKITIIPQDPTILSGSLRSTLDIFGEYSDAEIFEALRRVHLIPSSDMAPEETLDTINSNIFRNLDSPVSEAGENFSAGEKQLLCMARAILKKSKILLMDEATASVDYATSELIGHTIGQEFAESTILTIAHRLRSVITYDRVLLLDQGTIAEFDRPGTLLANPTSKFYGLCKASGPEEFAMLRKLARV